MSAPDAINPSLTGDVARGPLYPVRDQNLQMVVEQVGDQLRQLTLQRQRIDRRIALVKRTLKSLALLIWRRVPPYARGSGCRRVNRGEI
jgi:hypothetical protein